MFQRQTIDLLIECRWLLPMTDGLPLLEHQGVAVNAGRILEVGSIERLRQAFDADEILTLDRHAVMPGLVNAHNHAGMTLMRGYADDLPLMTWLNEHIWPAESAHMDAQTVADGTRLAMAEMLRSGTTTFSDMYLAPEAVAPLVDGSGMRAQLCTPLIDFATPWASNFTEGLEKSEALIERYRDHNRLRFALGPHAPYTVGDESLARLIEARERLGIPVQMHVHETRDEVERSLAQHGMRPLSRLDRAGLLTPDFQAIHMTQLEDDEIELVRDRGLSVVHCPQSNLKLASGFCPVSRLLATGINVALGTDGACSNNDLDMFDEMRTAALLAKGFSGDAATLPAMTALAMATRSGARAIGLAEVTGQLRQGLAADITAVDMESLSAVPVYHPASALVYAISSRQVSHVWVDGRLLVAQGQLMQEDERQLYAIAEHHRERMQSTRKVQTS